MIFEKLIRTFETENYFQTPFIYFMMVLFLDIRVLEEIDLMKLPLKTILKEETLLEINFKH